MSVREATHPLRARSLTEDPTVEGRSVRGLLFGLLIAALFWLSMAGLALALF